MTENIHEAARREYEETATSLRTSLTEIATKLPPGHPVASLLDAYSAQLDRTPYFYQRPNTEQPVADPGIRACFCASVDDPDDPEQHEIGCLHAEIIRAHAFWDPQFAEAAANLRLTWNLDRRPTPPAIPNACYEASFGWVHVRPGCRCPR